MRARTGYVTAGGDSKSIGSSIVFRKVVSIVMLLLVVFSTVSSFAASKIQAQANADIVSHLFCTWGTDNPSAPDESTSATESAPKDKNGKVDWKNDADYNPSPVRMMYQISQTEDLQKNLVYKSEVGAETEDANNSWPNVLTGKDFNKAALDIVNSKNETATKYTPYDLFGFAGLKWTGYQGEWNWIKVYYCGASGTGDDEKAPEDQKLNLYYPNRNRPKDQYADRFSTQDPRVQLKGASTFGIFSNNFTLNIANFLFSITKSIVALNNVFIQKSMSNVASDLGFDKIAGTIMVNLMNGLFLPLMGFMMVLTAMYMAYYGLLKHQYRQALTSLAKSILCIFAGFIMLAMPTTVANLPNDVGIILQYFVMAAANGTVTGSSNDMCSTDSTVANIVEDNGLEPIKNGKVNTEGISKWMSNIGNDMSRTMTCQYWNIFAVMPWTLGQYGTDMDNLYAKGKAPEGKRELNPKGTQGDWVGLAAVPLGNKQVANNWALYQISTQTGTHIPSTISDPKDGKIKTPDGEEPFDNIEQVYRSNRRIDQTVGDWWRVVDALSGWDTMSNDDEDPADASTSEQSGGLKKMIDWARKTAADDSHGYSQNHRLGNPDYDCSSFVSFALKAAGFNVNVFSTHNEASELKKAGFKDITNSVNIKTGDKMLPGDIVMSSAHTEIYLGDGKSIGAHHDENGGIAGSQGGDQKGDEISEDHYSGNYTQVFRLGDGMPDSETSFAASNDLLRYQKKDGADTTEYWNAWIGANSLARIMTALMSMVGLIAIFIPLLLGMSIVVLSVASVIVTAFAPVVLLFGMWAGKGDRIISEYLQIIWSIITKRVAYGGVYMIVLIITTRIMGSVTGNFGYMKSILLTVLFGIAIYRNRQKLVDLFMRGLSSANNATVNRIGAKMTNGAKNIAKAGTVIGAGGALGVVRKKKLYEKDEKGNYKLDKFGNKVAARDANGKVKYARKGDTTKNGKKVNNRFSRAIHGAAQGMGEAAKTQINMGIQRHNGTRQLAQANQAFNDRKRGDRNRFCVICNEEKKAADVQQYDAGDVCNNCADMYGVYSNEDLVNWLKDNGMPF